MKHTSLAAVIASTLSTSLLTPILTVGLASATFATNANTDETIVVTASRSHQDKFDVLAAVNVFDRDAIEQKQAASIGELLTSVAGITVSNQGTSGHQTSIFVRGSNSDHVLVLVNGVRVGSATLGSKDFSSIPVELIERVEVVRGPRAALWGSDAIGGVIQIFTRQQQNGEGQVGASIGHDGFKQVYGSVGFGNKAHQYTVSAVAEESDGFDVIQPDPSSFYTPDQPDKDGYDKQSLALVGTSQLSKSFSLEFNGQIDKGNTEIDASIGGDESDHTNYHGLIKGHWQFDTSYFNLGYSRSQDKNEDNADKLFAGATASLFETTRDQINGLAQFDLSSSHQLTVGGEWLNEEIDSINAYGENERDAYAVYVTGRHEFGKLLLEEALRYDEVGDVDSEVSYQLTLGYQLADNWLVAAAHGTAFKAPTFNDLYYPFSGNPDLVSETADNFELLTRYQNDSFAVELSAYRTNFDNLIEWAPIDNTDPLSAWQPSNIANATIKGVDLTINAQFGKLANTLTLSHIDAENDKSNKQLFLRPYLSANYQLGYFADSWNVSLEANYEGHRQDSSGTTLASYVLYNLVANLEVTEQLSLHAKLTNIADKEYQQVFEYPGDGQGYRLGIDYRF